MIFVVSFVLTLFFIIFAIIGIGATISDGLLAITAIIIFWYTTETANMCTEITKQNVLFARPVVVVKFLDNKILLKNDGKGPALNIQITDILTKFKYFTNGTCQEKTDNSSYNIPIISYIAQDLEKELIVFKDNKTNDLKGTVSEPDEFFQFGKISNFLIRYNDIEGAKYMTKIQIESGILEKISFPKVL